MSVVDRPLFSRTFNDPGDFVPNDNSTYFYGVFEQRSEHVSHWMNNSRGVKFVQIKETAHPTISTDVTTAAALSMRSRAQIEHLLAQVPQDPIYIDITGLSHHVWAPLVAVSLWQKRRLNVVYVEPANYRYSANPTKGEIFDLSERIEGISPLPLFTRLAEPRQDSICFVPLLGFEGARLSFLIEQVDPPGGKCIPVIGVPGFRPEYPFHAYLGNHQKLSQSRAWREVRYAKANCPFHLFYVLQDILSRYPGEYIKIAPIGTKPHALGAVLTCLASTRQLELVYDNPKRKLGRTEGMMHCLVYSISDFLSDNPKHHLVAPPR